MADLTSAKQSTKVSHYQVSDVSEVKLDCWVGEGQAGGCAVSLDGAPLAHSAMIKGLSLGFGKALRGKRLLVNATAIDHSAQTNLVSATLRLSGGTLPRELSARVEADDDQAVVFTFLINFL